MKAHEIYTKALPENHPDIGFICKAIGGVFHHKHDYVSALYYYEQAFSIFRKLLPPTHEFTEDVQTMIAFTRLKLLMISFEKDLDVPS